MIFYSYQVPQQINYFRFSEYNSTNFYFILNSCEEFDFSIYLFVLLCKEKKNENTIPLEIIIIFYDLFFQCIGYFARRFIK